MTDVHSVAVRSYNMSRIRGRNTKPELLVRKFLHATGFRYRLHVKTLPGKPDIVLPKYRTIIYIHGCFWHGHEGCRYFKLPETRRDWWAQKLTENKQIDQKNLAALHELGWKVIIVWECELKREKKNQTLNSLSSQLLSF